ncbi:hypothetical protein DFH06DRAFT_437640 [Mycena polygramma]|nr:hypothetical protein DFH06DRAFT_437640 [Mycena polygramma]
MPTSIADAQVEYEEIPTPALTKQLSKAFWTLQNSPWHAVDWFETPIPNNWELFVFPALYATRTIDNLGHFLDQFNAMGTSKLDESIFSSYLCCINAFFGPVEPRILVETDKSRLKNSLMIQLFKALQGSTADISLVTKILSVTVRLAPRSQGIVLVNHEMEELMTEICHFCITEKSPQICMSAATLAAVDNLGTFPVYMRKPLQLTKWVFSALEFLHCQCPNAGNEQEWDSTTTLALQSLLQFLAYTDSHYLPNEPTVQSVQTILRALSTPGDISLMAFLTLCHAPQWFRSPAIQPVLHDYSVWRKLGQAALEYCMFATDYIALGKELASVAEWKPAIHGDLPTWLLAFNNIPNPGNYPNLWETDFTTQWHLIHVVRDTQFLPVLQSVWNPFLNGWKEVIDHENTSCVLSLAVLS